MDSEIKLEDMVSFKYHSGQMYKGERLQQLMDSIKNIGLMCPVIVRPADNGKYEIICGHNRAKAAKALGYSTIRAEIKYGLSDDKALELFYDSNLNQQSFSDWNYAQKFEAIRYSERLIQKNSRQGKRTDLEIQASANTEDGTCVQSRQKLTEKTKKATTRDKMSKQLGICTATFSKYRRIIKLPDDLLQSIAQLLDEKKITFNTAWIISNKREFEIKHLIKAINAHPGWRIDLEELKKLPSRDADNQNGTIYPKSANAVLRVLVPPPSSDYISAARDS